MLTKNEYKVLSVIKELNDSTEDNQDKKYSPILYSKVTAKISGYEEYELNEIVRALDDKDCTSNLFSTDDSDILCTKITDKGNFELKHYHKNLFSYIFKRYIWVLFTIIITAILTGYFTAIFTK